MFSNFNSTKEKLSSDVLYNFILQRFDVEEVDFQTNKDTTKLANNLDMQFLTDVLIAFEAPESFDIKPLQNYPIGLLVNYLKKTHQFYISSKIPEIEQTIFNLAQKSQGNNPSLNVLDYFFSDYKQALLEHIEVEESELYPYILYLDSCVEEKQVEEKQLQPYAGFTLNNFMQDHDHEHEARINEIVNFLKRKRDNIQSHLSFKVLLTQFEAFKKDLRVHERLEEEVLIPKAKSIEKDLGLPHLHS